MAKRHMKKFSTSWPQKKCKSKTMLRFYFTPVRMATIKNTNNKCCYDVGKKELSYTVGGNVN
jgi:hypothetical protein